jgi:hypothetical protein
MSNLREHIERSERKRLWTGTPYPRTCEFLVELGIDPIQVAVDGITIHGYDTFDANAEGQRIYRDNELVRTRMEWPNPLVGMTVVGLMMRDEHEKRTRA